MTIAVDLFLSKHISLVMVLSPLWKSPKEFKSQFPY